MVPSCDHFCDPSRSNSLSLNSGSTARSPHVYPEPARADYYMQRSGDRRPPTILPNYPKLDLVPPPDDFDSLIERRFARRELLYTGAIDSPIALPEVIIALAGMPGQLRMFGTEKSETRRSLGELVERQAREPFEVLPNRPAKSSHMLRHATGGKRCGKKGRVCVNGATKRIRNDASARSAHQS